MKERAMCLYLARDRVDAAQRIKAQHKQASQQASKPGSNGPGERLSQLVAGITAALLVSTSAAIPRAASPTTPSAAAAELERARQGRLL